MVIHVITCDKSIMFVENVTHIYDFTVVKPLLCDVETETTSSYVCRLVVLSFSQFFENTLG